MAALRARIAHLSEIGGLGAGGLTAESTVNELFDEWLAIRALDQLNETTVARNEWEARKHIRPTLGELRLFEASTPILNHFVMSLSKTAYASAVQVRITLKLAFDYAVLAGAIAHNPVVATKNIRQRTKEVVAYAPEDLRSMRRHLSAWVESKPRVGRPREPTSLLVFDVLLGTGVRIGESIALLQGEYWPRGSARDDGTRRGNAQVSISGTVKSLKGKGVFRQPFPKTKPSRRVVSLPDFVAESIERGMNLPWAQGHELVFPSLKGSVRADTGIRMSWAKAFVGTKYQGVSPHDIRRSVATAVRNAYGLDAAAAQLGHSSSTTTSKFYVEAVVSQSPEVLGTILGLDGH